MVGDVELGAGEGEGGVDERLFQKRRRKNVARQQ